MPSQEQCAPPGSIPNLATTCRAATGSSRGTWRNDLVAPSSNLSQPPRQSCRTRDANTRLACFQDGAISSLDGTYYDDYFGYEG